VNHTDGIFPTQHVPPVPSPISLENERTPLPSATEVPEATDSDPVTAEYSLARDAFERGTALKRAGLFKQAAAHFAQAAQHPACAVKGLAQMGLCFKKCSRRDEAVAAFQRAVQISSGSSKEQVPILYLLGKTYECLGRIPEALETYRWIRRENPGYRDVADRIERLSSRRASPGLGKSPAALSAPRTEDFLKTWRGILRSRK